ncbi:MAG: glycosyltransferase family 4 protein [Vicinamibacterales bacterium]
MRRIAFVVPGSLDMATGGSRYDRMMVQGLRERGWQVDTSELDGAFPFPTRLDSDRAARAIAAIPDGTVTVIDGLVHGALPEIVEREAVRLPIVALVHLPIAADLTLDPARSRQAETGERRALAAARRIVVTGSATVSLLERYALTGREVVVIEPGTARRPLAAGSDGDDLQLLCVATLQPGKGHHILLEALGSVSSRNWHLTCAGSVLRDTATAERVRALVQTFGLDRHVSFDGELDEPSLAARYDVRDVFVLATLQETYGMAVAEALAHGLPVVSTACGAIPELVGQTAGLIVPPGDVAALRAGLESVISDGALRARLRDGARHRRELLPSPEHAVDRFSVLLEELQVHG